MQLIYILLIRFDQYNDTNVLDQYDGLGNVQIIKISAENIMVKTNGTV